MTVSSVTTMRKPAEGMLSTRRLAVAWQDPKSRRIQPVGMLTCHVESGVYEYYYVRNAADVPDFHPFLSFPAINKIYRSTRLFPIFSQRVMDARRPDFERYIRALDLSPEATPWEQIARSEGRRAGDTIMVFPEPVVFDDETTCSSFFVHGIRHALKNDPQVEARLLALRQGDQLTLLPEPNNAVNELAICVANGNGGTIGWVPDLLLDYVHTVIGEGEYSLKVRRTNGPGTPTHLRLLVELSGRVPEGYLPFAGSSWERWR